MSRSEGDGHLEGTLRYRMRAMEVMTALAQRCCFAISALHGRHSDPSRDDKGCSIA